MDCNSAWCHCYELNQWLCLEVIVSQENRSTVRTTDSLHFYGRSLTAVIG
jgi:hypothetical protein